MIARADSAHFLVCSYLTTISPAAPRPEYQPLLLPA